MATIEQIETWITNIRDRLPDFLDRIRRLEDVVFKNRLQKAEIPKGKVHTLKYKIVLEDINNGLTATTHFVTRTVGNDNPRQRAIAHAEELASRKDYFKVKDVTLLSSRAAEILG